MTHTRPYYISLLLILCLLTACNNNGSSQRDTRPLEQLPLEEVVGKTHQYPLADNPGMSYQALNPVRVRLSQLPEVGLSDVPFAVLKGQQEIDRDQLYPELKSFGGNRKGFELDFKYYFLADFDPNVSSTSGSKIDINSMELDLTIMDAEGNLIYREAEAKGTFGGSDSAYYCQYQELLSFTQLRNFTPGEQTLTLSVEGHGKSGYGKGKEKLIDFKIEFVQDLPPLVHSKVFYEGIKLTDEAYNLSWDEFLANPKPDIYWYLTVDGYEEYRASKIRNTQIHGETESFELFHYSLEDEVEIVVMDGDVFLNRDDVIGSWKGTVNELSSPEFQDFGMEYVEYCKVRMEYLGEYKPRGNE